VLRLWLTRRWLAGSLLAVLFGVACFYLGLWQWHRHVDKQTKADAIATNYDATPVPLERALAAGPLTPERQWTRVTLSGTYAIGSDLLVRNRTIDQTVGFEVLTPFTTTVGTLLVDRGWVPNADEATTTPPADPPPAGQVEVTGWLRTDEPSLGRDLPHPQLASINIVDARAQDAGLSDLDWYVVLGSQQPAAGAGAHPVRPLPRPEEDLGPHQAYAYQWWIFMFGGVAFVGWAMRRELEAQREGAAARPGDGTLPARPPKPKKVRIWDEEDA
jgi:cytochrome oxidase assembly protein ShyY1